MKFKAADHKVEDILFTSDRFVVPRYQRPYSWEAEQADELFNDIIENDGSFFLGTFVFNNETKPRGWIEIIDGQQRIISITLLLCALRDIAKEFKLNDVARRIQEQTIAHEDYHGNQTYRVQTAESLNEYIVKAFFNDRTKVKPKPSTSEHKMVLTNYNLFKERLFLKIGTQATHSNQDLARSITNVVEKIAQINAIRIDIDSEEEAYTIFETVNARGAELSVADLLKNLIFKYVRSTNGEDSAKKRWQKIEENLQESGIEISKFIRHYWLAKYAHVSERHLYREIKKKGLDYDAFLDELWEASKWYGRIASGTKEEWSSFENGAAIHRSLAAIRLMGVSQCYVLFLALLINAERIQTDVSKYFKVVEKFTFLYSAISKLQANKVEKQYSKYANLIFNVTQDQKAERRRGKFISTMDQLINDLNELRPSKAEFVSKCELVRYKNSEKSRMLIKYILERVNAGFTTGEHRLDFDVVNIEHILPQKPKVEDWGVTHSQSKEYVDMLGNLTLIHRELNSRAGNEGPKVKYEIFQNSEIAITKNVARELRENNFVWNRKKVFERESELVNQIWSLWTVEG